jgi:hypothetical protein
VPPTRVALLHRSTSSGQSTATRHSFGCKLSAGGAFQLYMNVIRAGVAGGRGCSLPATPPATLGALVISLTVGLFGFRESLSASSVTRPLALEAITVLALPGWAILAAAAPPPVVSPAPCEPGAHQMTQGRSSDG